jgi:hypothetical protein
MTDWHATVEYPGTLDVDQAAALASAAAPKFVVVKVDGGRGRTGISFGVEASTVRQAFDLAHRQARELVAGVTTVAPVVVDLRTDEALAVDLEQPVVPELVDGPGAQEILGGISQQRLTQLRDRDDFPEPIQTFGAGRAVWTKAAIEAFAARPRKPGRPPKQTR